MQLIVSLVLSSVWLTKASLSALDQRIIVDVMEDLVDRTLERMDEIEILFIEGGLEKRLLEENDIKSVFKSQAHSMRTIQKAKHLFLHVRVVLDEGDEQEKQAEMTALAEVADAYMTSVLQKVIALPRGTPRLNREHRLMFNLLQDWQVWSFRYQQNVSSQTSLLMSGSNLLITDRIVFLGSLASLKEKMMISINRTIEYVTNENQFPEESVYLRDKPSVGPALNAIQSDLDRVAISLNPNAIALLSDWRAFVLVGKQFEPVLGQIARNAKHVISQFPELKADGPQKLVLERRVMDVNLSELEFLSSEFSGLLSKAETVV